MVNWHATVAMTILACSATAWAGGPATAPAPAATRPATVHDRAVRLLAAGRQSDAEHLVFAAARRRPTLNNLYFTAVLFRSRFYVDDADKIFARLAESAPGTVPGQAAKWIVLIDADTATEASFAALDQLAAAHPADPLLLWMVAVECRQLHKNRVGIDRYRQLLKVFNPGPALVHQTMGNMYLDDGQPAEALKHYDLAITLEPAEWDYNSRGVALATLGRLDEAAAAYRHATELAPDEGLNWKNWADLCKRQGDAKGAAEKQAQIDRINAARQP